MSNDQAPHKLTAALSVAGSDSGGGAGIQADLRAFSFFRVHGTTAITALTAQNPKQVVDVCPLPPDFVRAQLEAVFAEFAVGAVKTGMLYSADIIRSVADTLRAYSRVPLVIDPVMVATSGGRLLRDDAVQELCDRLLPCAEVMTPNQPEAEIMLGTSLNTVADMIRASRELARRFECTAVVKGGHDTGEYATDIVSDGGRTWELVTPRLSAPTTHGTGCSLSAAVAACLARGDEPLTALRKGKAYVYGSLQNCVSVGAETWAMTAPRSLPLDQVTCREI